MALGRFASTPPILQREQRARVYERACHKITIKYFDPHFHGTDWPAVVERERERVLNEFAPERFEEAVHSVVASLGTSHTGFFHESVRRVPARLAIGATCVKTQTASGERWLIRDVHPEGPADRAGIQPTDIVLAVDDVEVSPPSTLMFPMETVATITVERDGTQRELRVEVPSPRSRKQPYSEPRSVLARHLTPKLGYVKATIFPGLIGIDVASELDAAFAEVGDCDRLILDLRGNLGGGLGVLRLMSHLTAGKVPIGYTVTRKAVERGYTKEHLPVFDSLPRSKAFGIARLALQYGWRDPSVALVSEGLGAKPWHGRCVILANEGTVSAGEMVCAFARERGLATIVGTETAGRLIPGSGFKVGHGYMVIFPKAAYYTWEGASFEGQGLTPDVAEAWSAEAYRQGRDNQLERAVKVVSGL